MFRNAAHVISYWLLVIRVVGENLHVALGTSNQTDKGSVQIFPYHPDN